MVYILPDGKQVDLKRVRRISSVRDVGQDGTSIDKYKLAFTIHLDRSEIVEVADYYHYNDWAEVKKRLSDLRKEVYAKWQSEDDGK
jgi:hypothetical protein